LHVDFVPRGSKGSFTLKECLMPEWLSPRPIQHARLPEGERRRKFPSATIGVGKSLNSSRRRPWRFTVKS
jgi:hypothetical protein